MSLIQMHISLWACGTNLHLSVSPWWCLLFLFLFGFIFLFTFIFIFILLVLSLINLCSLSVRCMTRFVVVAEARSHGSADNGPGTVLHFPRFLILSVLFRMP